MLRTHHISPLSLRPLILAVALLLLCLSSCTSIREAQDVVSTADSLRSEGVLFDDSVKLASAVSALEPLRLIYPTDYAHANYYYGRILREAGNQPEAMLAFLRVVHSRTQDHVIKGRSYCNIGIMCGLATEHELAYDMYERSAEEFLKAQDSIAYYYALIDMAFELAEQKRKDEAVSITNQIEAECRDYYVLTKIWETRADAYIQAQMYDSAIYCVRQLQSRGNQEPTGFLYAAQAFYWLGQSDSALCYAHMVMSTSNYHGDWFNVLFILSHCDSTLTKEDAISLNSEREDLRYYEYEPMKEKLIQATQLLQQNLNSKPNLTWLWAIIVTIFLIVIPSIIYVSHKKRQRQLISQQIENLFQINEKLIQKMEKMKAKHDKLTVQTQQIEKLQSIRTKRIIAEIELFCVPINFSNFREKLCWNDYNQMCSVVNKYMFMLVDKLILHGLTYDKEIQLCVLVVIGNFSDKQMAWILKYSDKSIRSIKRKVANSLGVNSKNLRQHLLKMVVLG